MKINTVEHFVFDAFRSLKRNKTITLASVITVAATLFILGIFLLVMYNVNTGVSSVESSVQVKVFLNLNVSQTDQNNVETALKAMPEVKDVQFESQSDALKKFKEELTDKNKDLISGYDETHNPLPSSFIVSMQKPDDAQVIADKIKNMSGVDSVGNKQDLIQKIIMISKAIKWVGIALFVLLIGVSLFLIVNTIRLTVFSRRREIGIMKFVGATDWFIRWPFVIEGMIIGLIGAVISDVILYNIYKFAYVKITENLFVVHLIGPSMVLNSFLWQFSLAGALIGALGSIIALRRFLLV
jgi:Cell division protein